MSHKSILRICAAAALLLGLFAPGANAQSRTYDVDLSVAGATVRSFTDAFSRQTGVTFSYGADLSGKSLGNVEIHARKASLEKLLSDAFAGKGLQYKVAGNSVALSLAQKAASGPLTVSGQVLDQYGEPLPGAGVIIKGTAKGTMTDSNGKYAIEVSSDATLEYSFIGYKTVEEEVLGRGLINVVLADDSTLLDDVVVVGYGTQSRKTLTTSVSKVDGEKLMDTPVNTVGDALKGKVPGLRVATSNSLAGESPRFIIRGGSSITLGNDPIYIVDGAIRDDLSNINPNDIESMEVLKDAASAAIYGARASNGVILVTTKKGSVSKGPQIVFDAQVGFTQPERKWDLLNSREQIGFARPQIAKIYKNSTGTLAADAWLYGANVAVGTGNTSDKNYFTTRYLLDGETIPAGYQTMDDPVNPGKTILFTDTDFQSQWMKTALWHKEYIGVNGGNESVKYAASVSYLQDDGMIAMNSYDVFTTHANVTFNVTRNLEASTTFDLSRQKSNKFTDNYFNAFGRGIMFAPTVRGYDDNGGWVAGNANANAELADFYETFYDRETSTNRASGTFALKWTIIPGLTANAQYNYYDNNYRGSYYAKGEVNGIANKVSTTRSTTETRTQTTRNTVSGFLAFNRTFADTHTVSATAGAEYMHNRYWYLTANSTGSVSDDVPIIDSGVNFTASNKDESQALMSYFGRVQYDYLQKYIISATFRADGSSKFAPGNQWGFFPAASAAWVISEEPFFADLKSTMNNLKFRVSYGQTGNNGIGLYDTYGSFSTGIYNGHTTLLPSAMQNTGMKWETTTQLDAGLDFGFFGDRLHFILDYYNKVTDNMLFSITLPDTGPYSSVTANVGSARFYGFEASVGADVIRSRDFSWTTELTYSFNRNKVLSLPEDYSYQEVDEYGNPTGNTAYRIGGYKMTETGYRFGGTAVGEPLGRIYGYQIDHILQTASEASAALYDANSKGHRADDGKQITGRKDAGDYEWKNRYGSARKDGEEIINAEDMFYLGNVMPHSTGGWSNTLRWKGFTLNVYMDYALGHSIINMMKKRMLQNTIATSNSAIARYVYDCWQYPGDTDAKYARYFPNDADYGNNNWGRTSDFNVEKADYLCLRDVSLYYDLPESFTKKLHIKKVTVGVTGNTLHYFTGVTGGINPETGISSSSGSNMYSAVATDNSAGNIFPAARRVLFNLKLTF